MSNSNESDVRPAESVPPQVAIEWGYDTPVSRSPRQATPKVVPDEVTLEPMLIRRATPAGGTPFAVTPKLRVPQHDYQIWLLAFATVGLLAAGILSALFLLVAL